jgi:hypothetical protein
MWLISGFSCCIFCFVSVMEMIESTFQAELNDEESEFTIIFSLNFLNFFTRYSFFNEYSLIAFIAELICFMCQWMALFYLSISL